MTASRHDQLLAAALVPLTDEIGHLHIAMQHLCSDLSTGHATSEQRNEMDRRLLEAVVHLDQLRHQLVPTVPGLVLDPADNERR